MTPLRLCISRHHFRHLVPKSSSKSRPLRHISRFSLEVAPHIPSPPFHAQPNLFVVLRVFNAVSCVDQRLCFLVNPRLGEAYISKPICWRHPPAPVPVPVHSPTSLSSIMSYGFSRRCPLLIARYRPPIFISLHHCPASRHIVGCLHRLSPVFGTTLTPDDSRDS